jgi:two-component system NtrC family sensor kinase
MTLSTKEQIFVVISDSQVTYLLERILKSAGYLTTIVRDRSTAEKSIETFAPALTIIADRLVDGNGLDFARSLLLRFPAMPVLMFVTQDNAQLLKDALRSGITDYLTLPLHTDDILRAVTNGLQNAQRRKEWVIRESRRATASLQRQVNELEALSRLGRSITGTLDLDSVLTAVVDASVELTGAEEGSLLLVDEVTGELFMRAARNFQEEFVRTFRLPIRDSLAGSVIRTGKPILIDGNTPQKIKTAYLVQGLLYVPLQIHGHVFGVLGVDNRQSRTPFTEHHVKLISAMADYAVIAIENARLYSNTSAERNKLETVLTRVQDGVIVLDQENRIVLANQMARAALGLSSSNLTGRLAAEILVQPELKELLSPKAKEIAMRIELAVEDGRVFNAQLTAIPDVGSIITMHDITYLKKLDRIKSEFVGTVSHDLRSPLTAILGYVELLDRVGPVNDQQRDFIRRIQVSVHNITELVNDLLNLGRIEAGFDNRRELIQLDQIIRLSTDEFASRVVNTAFQFEVDVPAQLPPTFGNPIQMRQMIDNLLDNAFKYTPEGGKARVLAATEGNQLIIQVSDSGVGIPAADLPYIFDKFYRAGNVPHNVGGSGLGLAIVKSIVENHHGRIWVETNVGHGTTFTVVLPVAESTPSDPNLPKAS